MVKSILIISTIFLTVSNLFSQTFEMSAKVVIKKDEQFLKITLTSTRDMWFELSGLFSNFVETQDTSKLFKYDSLNINYQDRLNDTLTPSEYYDITPSVLFFLHNGKYYKYSVYNFTSLRAEEKDQLLNIETSHPWEMMETRKRKIYKIPLSINPNILKFKPEKIYFQAVISYLPNPKDVNVEYTNIETEGNVRYRVCWKKVILPK